MEEKNSIRMNLITIFLIISLIINIITGFFIYKLYNDKEAVDSKLADLNNKVVKLENVINNIQSTIDTKYNPDKLSETSTTKEIDINNYVFELDSKNKYTIITDFKWATMRNDGGSNTSIYYQIDLDNNVISKVQEDYKANLGGTPSTQTTVIYIKQIDANIQEEVKTLLSDVISKEDINDSTNYHFFTISSLNIEKCIYNRTTIENINVLLKKIDELK